MNESKKKKRHVSSDDEEEPVIPSKRKPDGATEKKPRKKRQKKDPNKPKHPMNAYAIYAQKHFKDVKEKNPTLPFQEVSKIVAANWKSISAEKKERYLRKALKCKEKFAEEMESYVPPPDSEVATATGKKSKAKRDPLRPKNPLSAFLFFSADVLRGKDLPFLERAKYAGEQWAKLSDEQKQPYLAKAKHAREVYDEAMLEYRKHVPVDPPLEVTKPSAKSGKIAPPPSSAFAFWRTVCRLDHSQKEERDMKAHWQALDDGVRTQWEARFAELRQELAAVVDSAAAKAFKTLPRLAIAGAAPASEDEEETEKPRKKHKKRHAPPPEEEEAGGEATEDEKPASPPPPPPPAAKKKKSKSKAAEAPASPIVAAAAAPAPAATPIAIPGEGEEARLWRQLQGDGWVELSAASSKAIDAAMRAFKSTGKNRMAKVQIDGRSLSLDCATRMLDSHKIRHVK